jgi:acyl-CoA thioesterase-1
MRRLVLVPVLSVFLSVFQSVFLSVVLSVFLFGSLGCRGEAAREDQRRATAPPAGSAAAPVRPGGARRKIPKIVVLGDSLTAGLGLASDEAYPSLLQERLNRAGLEFEVVNAGVSGDTSAGGLSRLDWALQGDVRILIVALGGNDGLRGLPTDAMSQNLSEIIEKARARRVRVILAGMEAPPNYGRDYIVSFHRVYPDLARRYNVALVPFLLQNVAGIDSLNQRDGIHPTAAGARIVADNVWSVLRPMAEAQKGEGRTGS